MDRDRAMLGMPSFRIITLGCKVNAYESASLREALLAQGWVEAAGGDRTDVTVINTCIVTRRASHQSRQAIRKAVRESPLGLQAAVGCYAQVFPGELEGIEGLGLIVGNRGKPRLPELLKAAFRGEGPRCRVEDFAVNEPFGDLIVRRFFERSRAFLKVQDGCRSYCTYCIVPFARGPLRSMAPRDVLHRLRVYCDEGYREVVLTGIHLGKYGMDQEPEIGLKSLLRAVGRARLPLRIRLSSLHPDEVDTELVDMVASEEWLCPHFHISLQSGDDRVLENMGRHYRAGDFAERVACIHARMPHAAIGADVIAGFPGEDGEAHQRTCDLLRDLPLSYLHVFPFSARKGTAAAGFPGRNPPGLIKKRAEELRSLGREKRRAFYRGCLNKTFPVVVEGWESEAGGRVRGWTDNYVPVHFDPRGTFENRLFQVRLLRVDREGVIGAL